MSEKGLCPKPLSSSLAVADALMHPVMYALGGFQQDSIQETHHWHVQTVDPALIDPDMCAVVRGSSSESMQSHNLFLFHAPIFGGWRRYTLLKAAEEEFHIGWVSRLGEKLAQAAVHRLVLFDGRVRMLNGAGDSETGFFAVDPSGRQIDIRVAGNGVLGDHQFPGARLL